MDYNVVANLAGNLGSFSTAFKSYVRKCDSASKRLDKVEEEFDRYKAMSFKEYYLDKQIAKFMDEHATELAAKNEAQREAWINLERTHAEENLRALSEDELEDVKTEYIALTSDSASLKRLGKVATERENILREKENLKKLNEDNHAPAVIGFDILFTGKQDPLVDQAFAEECNKTGNVVVAMNLLCPK